MSEQVGGCRLVAFVSLIGWSTFGCSSPSPPMEGKIDTSLSVVSKVADSLKPFFEPKSSAEAPSPSLSHAPTPPPSSKPTFKKEAWMDTLADLRGVPPPNAAVLVEDEPQPRNLSSVEILIAQRYRPARAVEMTLRVFVSEVGTVRRYQLLHTSDPKLTPEYFVPPLLELRFTPASQSGKPVGMWTTLTLKIPKNP